MCVCTSKLYAHVNFPDIVIDTADDDNVAVENDHVDDNVVDGDGSVMMIMTVTITMMFLMETELITAKQTRNLSNNPPFVYSIQLLFRLPLLINDLS